MRSHALKIKPRLTLYLHGKKHFEQEPRQTWNLHAKTNCVHET